MKRIDFNQDWHYRKEGESEDILVTLPHDAMLHDVRDPESPASHAKDLSTGCIYLYEKRFYVPEEWKNKYVLFEFGGIYQNSKVYLNGQEAGGRPYGYVPFTVCADDFLEYGKENIIQVKADNHDLPNSRWYSGGGIYRPVSLITGNREHIEWEGVQISTLDIHPAKIQVKTEASDGNIYVEIRDLLGRCIAEGEGRNLILVIPEEVPAFIMIMVFWGRVLTKRQKNGAFGF